MKGNFNNIIQSDTPVLIDFSAEWCGPCKTQAPILAELAKELKDQVKILKIDVDKNQQVAQRYQIQSVPTLVLFKNGKNLWRQSGVVDKNALKSVIQNHI